MILYIYIYILMFLDQTIREHRHRRGTEKFLPMIQQKKFHSLEGEEESLVVQTLNKRKFLRLIKK